MQIKNLQRQCELGNEKIEECQKELNNTWEVAKEEAEKSKAAKEIIKALASKVNTQINKRSLFIFLFLVSYVTHIFAVS